MVIRITRIPLGIGSRDFGFGIVSIWDLEFGIADLRTKHMEGHGKSIQN